MEWLNPVYHWIWIVWIALAAWTAFRIHRRVRRVGVFADVSLLSKLTGHTLFKRGILRNVLLLVAMGLVIIALAGPRYGTTLREVSREGMDIVIALDVSLSMQAEDVAPNRLTRARNEIKKLLDELQGDRVALVLFAGDAFIQCPLTSDYAALRLFLDVADPEMIPTPGTDFPRAIAMAMRAFEGSTNARAEQPERVILVVSDGENHIDGLESLAGDVADAGVHMYTAGVGGTEGVPIPMYQNGRRVGFKTDQSSNVVTTRLEESALQALAGNGAYFRIGRTSSSLTQLTDALARIGRTEVGTESFEDYAEQFQWPLAVAVLLLFIEPFLRPANRPITIGSKTS